MTPWKTLRLLQDFVLVRHIRLQQPGVKVIDPFGVHDVFSNGRDVFDIKDMMWVRVLRCGPGTVASPVVVAPGDIAVVEKRVCYRPLMSWPEKVGTPHGVYLIRQRDLLAVVDDPGTAVFVDGMYQGEV